MSKRVKPTTPIKHGPGHPRFYDILNDMAVNHAAKNADYTGGTVQGPLGNFKRVSAFKRLYPSFDWASPFGTAIDYMLKQVDAMMALKCSGAASKVGENVGSRLRDVQTYAVIAEILDEEERNGRL